MNTKLSGVALKNLIGYETENTVAGCTNEILSDLLHFYSENKILPIWSLGNSFTSRLALRLKSRLSAELLLMLEMTLPGTPIFYYGDELGKKDCCLDKDMVILFIVIFFNFTKKFSFTMDAVICLGIVL